MTPSQITQLVQPIFGASGDITVNGGRVLAIQVFGVEIYQTVMTVTAAAGYS